MALGDKIGNKVEDLGGKAKEATGPCPALLCQLDEARRELAAMVELNSGHVRIGWHGPGGLVRNSYERAYQPNQSRLVGVK